jgi:hypothetical protein
MIVEKDPNSFFDSLINDDGFQRQGVENLHTVFEATFFVMQVGLMHGELRLVLRR